MPDQYKRKFPSDGKYLAAASGTKAQIWETTTFKEIARREHENGLLWDVAFSPDDKYLATASNDATARLWHWRPEDLIKEAGSRLGRNLTHAEWSQYIGKSTAYHATFPFLKIPGK